MKTPIELANDYITNDENIIRDLHGIVDIDDTMHQAYISGHEAAAPKWISVDDELPTKEDVGKEFLVAVLMSTGYEYQTVEWVEPEDYDSSMHFEIQNSWCGHKMLERKVTHWMPLPSPPKTT